MKLGISNIAWKKNSTRKALEILRQFGIEYVDVAPTLLFDDIDQIDYDILNLYSEFEIKFSGMQSLLYPFPTLSLFQDLESKKTLMDYLKKVFSLANFLGIKNLVFGSPKNRILKPEYKLNNSDIIKIFREISVLANDYDCIICFEANPVEYGCNFMTNTDESIEFIKSVSEKNFKLNLDLSTTILCGEDFEKYFMHHLDIIGHVHVSSPFIRDIINLDHDKNLEIFKKYNYEGFVVMEALFPQDDENLHDLIRNVKCFSEKYKNK